MGETPSLTRSKALAIAFLSHVAFVALILGIAISVHRFDYVSTLLFATMLASMIAIKRIFQRTLCRRCNVASYLPLQPPSKDVDPRRSDEVLSS